MHIRAIRGSFRRRVWHSCHTHATLLGGAAVPAAPTKHSCTNINFPTEFTEFTEASGRGYSPTDFTDAHRSFWLRIFSHRLHRFSQIRRVWHPAIPTPPSEFLPQNPLQVCLRKSSHRIHRIHRNFWRRRASHRFHRCSQIFLLCQKLLWVLWLLWEDSLVGSPNLCVSVQSVGEYLAQPETSVGSVGECADAKKALISLSLRSFVVYLQCKQYIGLGANTSIRSPTGASSDSSDRSSASRC